MKNKTNKKAQESAAKVPPTHESLMPPSSPGPESVGEEADHKLPCSPFVGNLLNIALRCPVCARIIGITFACHGCGNLRVETPTVCPHTLFVAAFQRDQVRFPFLDPRLQPAMDAIKGRIAGPIALAKQLALNPDRTYLLSIDGPMDVAQTPDNLVVTACIELPPHIDMQAIAEKARQRTLNQQSK